MMMTEPGKALGNPQLEAEKQHTLQFLTQYLADMDGFSPSGEPIPLSGGLLNFVWRVIGQPGSEPPSLIAKWATPFIATLPDVGLDPDRIKVEAEVLRAFSAKGCLSGLPSAQIRAPRLIDFIEGCNVLLMEDIRGEPELGGWIQSPREPGAARHVGVLVGGFIGRLHRITSQEPALQQVFNNANIQRTRLDFQYKNVDPYAHRARLAEADRIGRVAVEFGEMLQQPGTALIMGDLWPPSILVCDEGVRIIDWELAHYGRPAQDVGHFAAHLWMQMHRNRGQAAAENARHILEGFLPAYRASLGDRFDSVFGKAGVWESAIHFGCEVLTRAVGNFQVGYLYEGLAWDAPIIQEAAACAADHILSPLAQSTFDALDWRALNQPLQG
jgi:aminoglycoside phosphotransferase (APT) family kinase protein